MFKRVSRAAVLLGLACGFAFQASGQTCSNADYAGTYFVLQQGTYMSSGSPVSYASLARVVSDGNGGVTGSGTEHNGMTLIQTFSLTGTYTVRADCSGVQTVTVRPASGSAYATNSLFQLLGRGQQAVITSTDASRIFSSVAYRAASVCNNAAVTGSYAGLETGINYSPSDVFAGVGAGVGDGQGNMAYTYNVNDMALGMVSAPNTHGIYSIASDCTGTATLNGRPHVVGLVLGGRIVAMEITSGSDPATGYLDPVGAVTNVPHIGVNGGWDTNVILVNPGSLAATVQVNFFGDDGNPLQLPLIAPGSTSSSLRSSMSVSVPAHASASVSTAGSPSASNIGGWAQINGSREITAYAVFGWPLNGNASNGLTQAVSYDACVSNTSVTVPFDNSGGRIFGIGVANPGSAVANIAVTVTDATGRLIGQGSQGSVPVNGHTQFLLSQLVPATSGIGGTVSLTSSAGPLAVTALQFNSNGSFTSVPIACR